MLAMQLTHENLARLRAVLYAATARRADMHTEVVLSNVPAVVSDFYRRARGLWLRVAAPAPHDALRCAARRASGARPRWRAAPNRAR